MPRTEYRYRVIIVSWPEGSKDADGRSVRFWKPEPKWGITAEHIAAYIRDGYFRWPRRVTYATASAAEYTADLYRKYGAGAKVIRSQPILWDEAEDYPPRDPKRKQKAIAAYFKILEATSA